MLEVLGAGQYELRDVETGWQDGDRAEVIMRRRSRASGFKKTAPATVL
jgi:hypothetical protein